MPVYLFTYHTYGSWMPDRRQGYVKRHNGVLPPDHDGAKHYRGRQVESTVTISANHQRAIIESILEACSHIETRPRAIATDDQHLHTVVSWIDESKHWSRFRTSIKRKVTIDLKAKFAKRNWLARGSSRRRVRDQEHFDYLVETYLPSHRGWKWSEGLGFFE